MSKSKKNIPEIINDLEDNIANILNNLFIGDFFFIKNYAQEKKNMNLKYLQIYLQKQFFYSPILFIEFLRKEKLRMSKKLLNILF